jgi:hypothetical protein
MEERYDAHQWQLQHEAKRFQREMDAQADRHAYALQAEVNRRLYAEAEKEQEYQARVVHDSERQYYKQEYYTQLRANQRLRRYMQDTAVAVERPWDQKMQSTYPSRDVMPLHEIPAAYELVFTPVPLTTASGAIRTERLARESSHPYRRATPYPRFAFNVV